MKFLVLFGLIYFSYRLFSKPKEEIHLNSEDPSAQIDEEGFTDYEEIE